MSGVYLLGEHVICGKCSFTPKTWHVRRIHARLPYGTDGRVSELKPSLSIVCRLHLAFNKSSIYIVFEKVLFMKFLISKEMFKIKAELLALRKLSPIFNSTQMSNSSSLRFFRQVQSDCVSSDAKYRSNGKMTVPDLSYLHI